MTDNLVSRATTVCVLTLLLCLASYASGEYESKASNGRSPQSNYLPTCEGTCDKRAENLSGMWFGPRLGRRRRSDPKQETDSVMALANALEGARLAVIMIPATADKRKVIFNPRMGRDSSEDQVSYEDAIDRNEIFEDEPPIYSPRLGRRLSWTPRLGRQSRAFQKL